MKESDYKIRMINYTKCNLYKIFSNFANEKHKHLLRLTNGINENAQRHRQLHGNHKTPNN
jgi:hypothetical protein